MKTLIALVILTAASLGIYYYPDESTSLRISVLNIGQGDSIYFKLPSGEDVLIDAGPDDRVLAELGKQMRIGDRTIEHFIVSHNHADHIGGFDSISRLYTINQVWISGAVHTTDQYISMLQIIKEQGIPTTVVKAGDVVEYGDVKILNLHPTSDAASTQPDDQHEATLVQKVSFKNFCGIFTGDLDGAQEEEVLRSAATLNASLNCQFLKISHHGSRTGSTPALLDTVAPSLAAISLGAKNRYGHPAPEVMTRLNERNIATYRTDLNGTITVTTDGSKFWTRTEK